MSTDHEDGHRGPPAGALSALLLEIARESRPKATWDPDLGPGSVVAHRFEILRELGRGGFGVVYKAWDRELGRNVAFKAVRAGPQRELREERLLREAEAAARLSHPNIVTLHDVGRGAQGPYLVLELLDGETLASRLRKGRMAPREAVRVAVEVAKGLAHAHAAGVVHRDLTPGNVFLCEDGRVKVLDLGMAHAFGRRRVDGGTPAYMAPEQRRGAPEDERTDVFALGCVLHEMLSAERPFEASPPPSEAPRLELPEAPGLADLVARMLAHDPVERPRDAAEVLAALSAFQRELERAGAGEAPAVVRRPVRRRAAIAAALALGALAGGTAILARRPAAPPPEVPSVAVLPFTDLSPEGDQEYLSDGIAEEILATLSQVEGLRVAGRASSFSFKAKPATLDEIGRALHATTVVEGSVRKVGQRIRVTARVSNAADGYQRWSRSFDRDLSDVFAVQEEIARAVVTELEVKLVPEKAPRVRDRRTSSAEAYTEYLLGKQLYLRHSAGGYRRAAEAFERAIALDPGYAPAHAQLAVALRGAWFTTADPRAAAAHRRRALEAAERAVELGPELPEPYAARALLRHVWLRDWSGAESDLRRALDLDPRDAPSRRRLGLLLEALGRPDEAYAEVQRAAELDPLDATTVLWLGVLRARSAGCEAGRPLMLRTLDISPESEDARGTLAFCDLEDGRYQSALALAAGLGDPDRLVVVAVAQRKLGRDREAARALTELVSRWGHNSAVLIASYYACTGDPDGAFEWLDRALEQELSDLRTLALRKLRGDPRWEALLRKMNLPADRGS